MLCFDIPFDLAPALFEIELVPPFLAIVAEIRQRRRINVSRVGRGAEPAKVLHHNTVEVACKAGDCAAKRGHTFQRYSRLDLVRIPCGPTAAVFFSARIAGCMVGLGTTDVENTRGKS